MHTTTTTNPNTIALAALTLRLERMIDREARGMRYWEEEADRLAALDSPREAGVRRHKVEKALYRVDQLTAERTALLAVMASL